MSSRAEGRHGLFDCSCDGIGISGVRLNCDRLSASAFNCFDHGGSRLGVLRVRDGHACSIRSQTLRNRCANAARSAGNQRYFFG